MTALPSPVAFTFRRLLCALRRPGGVLCGLPGELMAAQCNEFCAQVHPGSLPGCSTCWLGCGCGCLLLHKVCYNHRAYTSLLRAATAAPALHAAGAPHLTAQRIAPSSLQGIINNPNFTRYVRFNAMQVPGLHLLLRRRLLLLPLLRLRLLPPCALRLSACCCRRSRCCRSRCRLHPTCIFVFQLPPPQAILLDIILILPGLIESIVRPPMGGPGLQVYITL